MIFFNLSCSSQLPLVFARSTYLSRLKCRFIFDYIFALYGHIHPYAHIMPLVCSPRIFLT